MRQQHDSLSLNTRELQILCVVPVGSTVAEKSFFCIRYIDNWLRNSMLTDLLRDFAIIAVHDHTILIFKIVIYNVYMSIYPRGMMVSSYFIDSFKIMIVIFHFLQNLNRTTSSLSSRAL